MEDNLDWEYSNTEQKRPSFLVVLCVLSWIAAGLSILSSLAMIAFKDFFVKVLTDAMNQAEGKDAEAIALTIEHMDTAAYMNIGFYVVSIVAVILMFKLKKVGYFIYVPLHLAISFAPYTYVPFQVDGSFIFSMIILFGFIVMYGVNFKYLK